jgi:hypothetical protein
LPRMNTDMKNVLVVAAALVVCGGLVLTAKQKAPPAVFTSAQAEAGRAEYFGDCVRCHTEKLTGRKGEPGELPLLSSLPPEMQKNLLGMRVPPLAGADFMAKWGPRTTQDLSKRIWEAAGPDTDRYLKITAYVLQFNGAKEGAEALTADTAVVVREATGAK